ncbi:MAG: hypothetical protein Q8S54_03780 [Bacteroidota bacterium]|nr:hypothetical protein [Bacteroidota bacterium]
MRAIEFKSKLSHNRIIIPKRLHEKLKILDEKNIRVMILPDEMEIDDDVVLTQITIEQFLNGYADSDSIYDNY